MITLDQIASRCDKVRWQGQDKFTACCPAHQDRSPSLSVADGGDKILVHCHSGCPQGAVLDALGMTGNKDYVPPAPRPRKPPTTPKTYPYAKKIWRQGSDDDACVSQHPYAIRKRIGHAFGARRGTASGRLIGYDADCLLVPNRSWDGYVIGVEAINAEGKKQTFGNKGMLMLGHPEGADLIHVCEGWATAYAISKIFPLPFACIVAFGKSKLDALSKSAMARYRGDIACHFDDKNNRDVWDLWQAGHGEEYMRILWGRTYGR